MIQAITIAYGGTLVAPDRRYQWLAADDRADVESSPGRTPKAEVHSGRPGRSEGESMSSPKNGSFWVTSSDSSVILAQ